MKKDLRKIISLVSALAMFASTASVLAEGEEVEATADEAVVEEVAEVAEETVEEVAEEAATAAVVNGIPSDVVGTKYEQAVKELVALKVVSGYEDGTYKPDNNITRAEATKLLVAAMGPNYLETALGAAGKDTEFSDVPGSHWAAGYVSTGVANDFIKGMGDGTFAPEENITYAQIVKMIIASMGYSSICEKQGGYPNGYLSVASAQGVTAGVTTGGADTIVSRGIVAQLLDNAVKLPIVAITGYEESSYTGQLVAKTQIMDKIDDNNAEDYRTLLTENHNVYVVKGRIVDTKRSDDGLEVGKVRFNVEAAKNFDDTAYGSSYESATKEVMAYDGADAEAMMFAFAEALVAKDDNDEYTILTLTPVGKNETAVVSGSLFDQYDAAQNKIDVYVSADSSKTKTYKLSPIAEMYVNGVSVDFVDATTVAKYVENNNNGEITFIDATEEGKTTTDGKIDYILVTYYDDAIVDSVQVNASNYKVYWKNSNANISKGLTIDPEDEDVVVTYTKDGEAISYTDLNEYDVVSVAYDVTKDFKDSTFYDVRVSDKKVSGKVTGSSENSNDEKYYTVGGEDYTASYSMYAGSAVIEVGTEYVLYLNAFGNIADFDEDSTTKVIGIIDNANIDSSDTRKVRIITSAGTKTSYSVKDNSKTIFEKICKDFFANVPTSGSATKVDDNLANMLAEYTVNSNGYITSATKLTDVAKIEDDYKASTNKFGSKAIADSTIIIDLSGNTDADLTAQDYTKVSSATSADLEDGAAYEGYVASKSKNDGTYRFVVITASGSLYTGDTTFAVYSKGGSVYDDLQATSVDTIIAYGAEDSEAFELKLDTAVEYTYDTYVSGGRQAKNVVVKTNEYTANLKKGDVFVYDTDSDGYVTDVKVLFTGITSSYSTFLKNAIAVEKLEFEDEALLAKNLYVAGDWFNTNGSTKSGEVSMIFGTILDKKNSNITIGATGSNVVDFDNAEDVTVASGANIYVYDYTETKADNRLYKGTLGNIVKTNVPANYKYADAAATSQDNNGSFYKLTEDDGSDLGFAVNFIMAKTVDDDMTDILVIVGDVE